MYNAIAVYIGTRELTPQEKHTQETRKVVTVTLGHYQFSFETKRFGQAYVDVQLREYERIIEEDKKLLLEQIKRDLGTSQSTYILASKPFPNLVGNYAAAKVREIWHRDYGGTIISPPIHYGADMTFYEDQYDGLLNLIKDEGFQMHKAIPKFSTR
jgi:predicted metallo-beta-lactamase superfamily hydrolase